MTFYFQEIIINFVRKITGFSKQGFGENGFEYLQPSQSATSNAYCAVQFVTQGTISALATNSSFGTSVVGVTFPAGFVLYVPFTSVTAGSASVIAYRASL